MAGCTCQWLNSLASGLLSPVSSNITTHKRIHPLRFAYTVCKSNQSFPRILQDSILLMCYSRVVSYDCGNKEDELYACFAKDPLRCPYSFTVDDYETHRPQICEKQSCAKCGAWVKDRGNTTASKVCCSRVRPFCPRGSRSSLGFEIVRH